MSGLLRMQRESVPGSPREAPGKVERGGETEGGGRAPGPFRIGDKGQTEGWGKRPPTPPPPGKEK